jgi:hypothetical protein
VQALGSFPTFNGTLKVHCRIHKSSPLSPILKPDHNLIPSPEVATQYYIPIYVLNFLVVTLILAFLEITYTRSSSPPFVPHVPPTSSYSI